MGEKGTLHLTWVRGDRGLSMLIVSSKPINKETLWGGNQHLLSSDKAENALYVARKLTAIYPACTPEERPLRRARECVIP